MTIDPFLFDDDHTIAREPDPLFESMVKNAIDFLKKSVDELEKDPKYSVIHFFAAIELFLKARLLAKHWTLILANMNKVKNEEQAILENFKEGNVNTVGLEDAIKRLKRECGLEISPNAKKYFRAIKKHRNKLVHFFHSEYHKDPPYGTYHEIVPEQLSAWYHLNTLLMDEWEELFEEYADEIHELDSMIMANKKYLSAKYDELKPDIEKEKKWGIEYKKCSWCGFESARYEDMYDLLYSRYCLVCFHQDNTLHIECPDCQNEVLIEEQGIGECSNCGFSSDIDYLISELVGYQDPKEDPEVAYCAECEYSIDPSVICLSDEKGIYLCLSCLTIHFNAGKCGFCDTYVAGKDLEASYSFGCIFCDGAAGHDES
jgi:hypothetical protein